MIKNTVVKLIQSHLRRLEVFKKSGCPRYCGCSDYNRRVRETIIWESYMEQGPGHLVSIVNRDVEGEPIVTHVWILEPDVTREEFEEDYFREVQSWRHDFAAAESSLKKSLEFLTSNLHKTYKDTAVGLCASTSVPESCLHNIMAFL